MATTNGHIPNGHPKKEERPRDVFRISGLIAILCCVPLPLFAFVVCIVLSVMNDFEESTYTTCSDPAAGKVRNFLPSISSAIGGFTPQRYIWRIFFAVHLTPRFIFALMHYNYNMGFPVTSGLSWFRPVHEKGFLVFVGCATFYMICVLILYRWARHDITWSSKDVRSYRLKVFFCVCSIFATVMAMYFFNRHMQYCEPNIYSWFAIFEYMLVFSNVSFHSTWLVMEFSDALLHITVPVRPGQYASLPV
ncbi:hypothetical protein LSH36_125g00000 [Paralvinella palmiformis]|uniref:CWH43-like N-terminal domain-containing protein n=1 Tax=Paralvinella palmiformis TaxID=53620 RepID=A0AAD9JX00_9ANNE|nr:hypothetical protein LSH36_125g00000 [Paralvinella palmiformis]